ncbi:Carboxylesterase 2 [Rubrivivax sp. A210]|uniref:alpha/beta hydrolase n=1 Tax=Rubrivivax sp. A210 TaxID=2772301 RepID=UPI0019182755|nr:prolyl oligopeptidase family serine peptidase [Rubrivivax sp. A210]CAD5372823.1 Carboxylesterase 2 [Rubrivivax sp. A210]
MNALETIEVHPASEPRATVIVLHGLGADGTDFLPFADEIRPAALGPLRWVFPRAPERPVTLNGGARMRAWYDILGTDLQRREDVAGLRESFTAVHALIAREVARGMPAHRIVLAGFSQGCAITLGAGLRCPQRLAGLAGLSGYLPLADLLAAEHHAANAATPVFLAHGQRDGVVPLARGAAARDQLQARGQPLDWHEYPMEHSVCMEEVQALQQWLLRVLPGA